MITLVCLLEERSAEEMLAGIFKRLLPDHVSPIIIPFEGKQDLEKQLEKKIRNWQKPDSVFLIMRDKDAGDCVTIKARLLEKVKNAGKQNCSLIRIACHELESFYLGDLLAVEKGLELSGISRQQDNRKYSDPDRLANAKDEFKRLTKMQYQQIAGSRAIAPHLNLDGENRSHSFNVLISGIKHLINA